MGKGKRGDGLAICGAACICCCTVVIVLSLLGLGIAKTAMGVIHLYDCPLQDKVPIWLIVSGIAPIFFGGSASKQDENGEESPSTVRCVCGIVALIFNLAWLICGSLWVYPTYGTVNKDDFVACIGNATTSCSQDCYMPTLTFAFAMVTLDWIFFVLWFIIIMCSIQASCCRSRGGARYA